jgi:metal-dependent amidase/aminoacylase/carboxypeptidase family protein
MLYRDYLNIIDEQATEICGVSDGIWDLAETAFGEYRSADLLADALEKNGFTVLETEGFLGEDETQSDRLCFLAQKGGKK